MYRLNDGDLYFTDMCNNRIRKITWSTRTITTIAGNGYCYLSGDGGPATSASLCDPIGIVMDASDNIYVTETGNHRVRKITSVGIISSILGSGIAGAYSWSGDNVIASNAGANFIPSVTGDTAGNLHYADKWNHRVRLMYHVAYPTGQPSN